MKRVLVWALASAVVAAVALWLGFMWLMRPSYHCGDVRAGKGLAAPLDPPPQVSGPDWFDVEPGVRLYAVRQGARGPRVLMVHGGPGVPTRPPMPGSGFDLLKDKARWVYFDQRGCGKSTRPVDRVPGAGYFKDKDYVERRLGLAAAVADIERIRRALGDDKIVLLGHSWGGFLAALYAAEFPEHVAGLVLVAPAAVLKFPPEGGDMFKGIESRLPAAERPAYRQYMKEMMDFGQWFKRSDAEHAALNRRMAEFYVKADGSPALAALLEAHMPEGNGGWSVMAQYMSMGLRHDYRPGLRAVTAPALVLHGDRDMMPPAASEVYAKTLPNARLVVVPQAGHFMFLDQPQAFAREVGAFLQGLN